MIGFLPFIGDSWPHLSQWGLLLAVVVVLAKSSHGLYTDQKKKLRAME